MGRDTKLMRGVALSTSDTIVLTYCQALRQGGEGLRGVGFGHGKEATLY